MIEAPSLEQIAVGAFDALIPPENVSVTEAAGRYHIVHRPGSHTGPWSVDKTPYIREPQDVLTSLDYTAMIFAGPARTGKSAMGINWLCHTAIVDPVSMMFVHPGRNNCREWSKDDLATMLTHSPAVAAKIKPGRGEDNTFDREFRSGMRLEITWPTQANLAGKTRRFTFMADRDRVADNIDGQGEPFDQMAKRGETYGRWAMAGVESSPGRDVIDPKWTPKTPHEAPPCNGILGLYNRGDRRRWYWPCPQCEDSFEPAFGLLHYPRSEDIEECAEGVTLVCPRCGYPIEPRLKDELNRAGRWVRDGLLWRPSSDRIEPIPGCKEARGDVASFWLKGPAAGFQTWASLVRGYERAEREFQATGKEDALRTTVNVSQGEPYIPRARVSERLPEDLKARAEDWGSSAEAPTVAPDVRFLVPAVDVQGDHFVVQVHGFTPTDLVVIDGYKIRWSDRVDPNGERLPIDPGAFGADWDLLVERVLMRAYPVADGSGRVMRPRLMVVDSGGQEGVTHQAYAFWRRLKGLEGGLHRRVMLVKGGSKISADAPRTKVSWPDSKQTGARATARGDVPVVMLNTHALKDQIAGMLARRVAPSGEEVGGGGMIRYPSHFEDWFYAQMTNEVRGTDRKWSNPARRRNEAFDLAVYALAAATRPYDASSSVVPYVGWDRVAWDDPPGWAAPWDRNDLVSGGDEPVRFAAPRRALPTLEELARQMG